MAVALQLARWICTVARSPAPWLRLLAAVAQALRRRYRPSTHAALQLMACSSWPVAPGSWLQLCHLAWLWLVATQPAGPLAHWPTGCLAHWLTGCLAAQLPGLTPSLSHSLQTLTASMRACVCCRCRAAASSASSLRAMPLAAAAAVAGMGRVAISVTVRPRAKWCPVSALRNCGQAGTPWCVVSWDGFDLS